MYGMQVKVGHAMIEHKRPALTDSFFQVGENSSNVVSESMTVFQYPPLHIRLMTYQRIP